MATRPGKRPPPEPRPEPAPLREQPEQTPPREQQERNSLREPAEPILVGRISGAWGVHGWVRVAPFNDPRLSLLLQLPVWWLRRGSARLAGRRPQRDGVSLPGHVSAAQPVGRDPKLVQVEQSKPHGAGEIVAKLAGIDDREAALALEGSEVLLSREQFPTPEADEVYWADLIGCRVLDPDGESLGVVVAIDDQPAHPVMRLSDTEPLEVSGAQGRDRPSSSQRSAQERLVPFVPERILSIDLAARVIVADWRRDY